MSGGVPSLAGTPAAAPLGYYSWTFGQAARDPFYIMVIIYIFYPYFSNTVVGDPVRGQEIIGYLTAGAGLILALTAPFLGAIADKNGRRKPWVGATVAIIATGASMLWLVQPGDAGIGLIAACAILLTIKTAFTVSEVFHNAMLPSIVPVTKVGAVSGLAFSLGNVGGLSCILFVLYAFALPGNLDWSFLPDAPLFGVDQSLHEHDRIVGPIAGVWMLLFTLPVLLFTPDGKASTTPMLVAARQGFADVVQTFKHLKHYSNIALYLLARMFFIDGMVGVLTFGGVYASGNFQWGSVTLLLFGLATSASAMIGAYFGGKLDDRLGSIRTLKLAIGMASLMLLTLVSIEPGKVLFVVDVGHEPLWSFPYFASPAEFIYLCTNQVFAVFFVTGLASSRTLMARISPPDMATQFFGLFALSGTVTAFLAPLMVATTTGLFDSQRAGFSSLIVLMVIGAVMLFWVREEQSQRASGH